MKKGCLNLTRSPKAVLTRELLLTVKVPSRELGDAMIKAFKKKMRE